MRMALKLNLVILVLKTLTLVYFIRGVIFFYITFNAKKTILLQSLLQSTYFITVIKWNLRASLLLTPVETKG